MSQPDRFRGAWRVSEYVYNPDGSFAGIVRQRRELQDAGGGRLRVIQTCEPDAALADHPMAAFAGRHVFQLEVEGRVRRYLGAAVIGTGLPWGEGAMTGRGLWPHFGHNFTSFAVLPTAERQLTGGRFSHASALVANIAGIAVPEGEATGGANNGGDWPRFAGPQWPGDLAAEWRGSYRNVAADGTVLTESSLGRTYKGSRWDDWIEGAGGQTPLFDLEWRERAPAARIYGHHFVDGAKRDDVVAGMGGRFGWLLEFEGVCGPETLVEGTELLDPVEGHLVAMRRWFHCHELARVEVFKLRPS